MASVVRATALRAGGACVRCRKGKTKCVYENGRAPCKNCAKGMHDCYLPSESMSHGGHGVSPARVPQRSRESLPSDARSVGPSAERNVGGQGGSSASRHTGTTSEKLTPELLAECERVVSKTIPACVAFHKPSFIQQLKGNTMDLTMVNALLTMASRHSPVLIRRYGSHGGATGAAEHFALKSINGIMQGLDHPSLADIQAICLLVIHEWGSRNAVRAYIYLGQAARMAQMYRVAHAHEQSEPQQFVQSESFRRTMWLIYILDCFLTASPGRHPALSQRDVRDMALPCLDMNYTFDSPAFVRTLDGTLPSQAPHGTVPAEVGEFGHFVLATKAWRNVIELMTTTTLATFTEDRCQILEAEIENIRSSLPPHFSDKPGQIAVHITMGSGYTYAMIHCLLHCASIFLNRRRILQDVSAEGFSADAWRASGRAQLADQIFGAAHSIVSMLTALEGGAEKDSILCFPIFMLFAAFTSGAAVAYLQLKGLTPADVRETTSTIVRDVFRFLKDGADCWPLIVPWQRHLSVMAKVLKEYTARIDREESPDGAKARASPSIKDDVSSQPDTSTADVMDYDQTDNSTGHGSAAHGGPPHPTIEGGRDGSEPPAAPRRPGIATINGGSAGNSTPATGSPAPMPARESGSMKIDSPDPNDAASGGSSSTAKNGSNGPPAQQEPAIDSADLCAAFERQLLELDDLAAFMGGGV
ncbi:hypothetical protein MCOR02_006678 [Pyricularia oryzae]|nr:hypothetical protein MCOR02_006678 [Pyricularia oryzae]KAI6588487.1 hypothetical protein MCOR04_004152 [Pyricularia oryzae]